MTEVPFQIFDADNHYYEAEDAFIRYVDPKMHKRCMQWAELDGRKRLLVGGRVNRFIPNPTFDPVAKPGCLDEFYRARKPGSYSLSEMFGELDPINPAYRRPDERIKIMDTQGIEKVFLFPTLGVGMTQARRAVEDQDHRAAFLGVDFSRDGQGEQRQRAQREPPHRLTSRVMGITRGRTPPRLSVAFTATLPVYDPAGRSELQTVYAML